MSDDKLGFLDETDETPEVETVEAEAPEAEVEEVKAEAEEPAEEPKAEEVEATGEEEAAPPVAEVENDPQKVPLMVALDAREKRQAAERRAEEAERKAEQTARQLAEMQAQIQRQQEQRQAPDWYEDPQAAAQYQAQSIQQQVLNDRMNQSQFFAEREFGKEAVAEADAFIRQNPGLVSQFQQHPSPWHALVEFHQKQKFLAEVGENPDAYKEQMREQIRQELMAEMTTSQPSKPKAPPPSMATAPSTGRDATTPGNTFDTMFS